MKRFILLVALAAVARPATSPRAGYAGTIAKSSEYIRQTMAEKQVEGISVALLDGEEVVWEQGFGWADRERAVPVTPDTVFHIASVSKVFTTVALLALVDEGKVDLDAPVSRYLPQFRMSGKEYGSITVRHLLSHQSGIPGSYGAWGITTAPVLDFGRRLTDWLAGEYMQSQPGYYAVYTNNGFNLVDAIVSAVSGKTWPQFIRERITEPLGMSRTGIDWMDPALAANLSKSYIDGKEQSPEYINVMGAGGVSSTAGDLCRLLAMVNGGGAAFGRRVLKAETVAEMNRDQTAGSRVRVYGALMAGLGWDDYAEPALAYAGAAPAKSGGSALFGSQIVALPKYGLGVAVTSNRVCDVPYSIAMRVLMAALEERHGISPPAALQIADATPAGFDLQPWAGSYASGTFGGILDLRTDGSTLDIWQRSGDSYASMFGPLTHRGDGWFAADSDPGQQFTVRPLDGRNVILMRNSKGHYWKTNPVGERLGAAPALSEAWKRRVGKTWVAADLDIAGYSFSSTVPAVRLNERDGRLVCERYADAGSEDLTSSSQVLEPVDDGQAATPLRLDCRDLTHLQVVTRGGEEWLRFGAGPSLWRPLEGIAEPEAARPYTASIAPEVTEWVKLPAGSREYVLTVPDAVRWSLYNERLQPLFEAWGGAWRLAQPAGSKDVVLYLALHSLSAQRATVQRLEGSTFRSQSGVLRLMEVSR